VARGKSSNSETHRHFAAANGPAYLRQAGRRLRARVCALRGFTIIELMITLAVAAILTMLAMPSFKHLMISTNLSGVNNDLTGAMQFARTEAVSRQTAIAVAASAGNWQNGWTVQIAPAGTVLRTYAAVAPQYVVNGNAVTKVTFQPQGSLAPPSGSTAAVAATCITISSAGFGSSRFLQVLPAGMVQQTTSATAPTGSTCAAPTP
jgi:type IV fimbrial biogenesis protein FimT